MDCECFCDDEILGACAEVSDWVELHCRKCCIRPEQWVQA